MDLDTFIKETLVQISNGVKNANDELAPQRVNDDGTEPGKLFLLTPGSKQERGAGVHFDVAVTTHTVDEGKAGAKVRLSVLEADLGGKIQTSEQAVSRIKFSVNIGQWHG